jgi:hypothetical protein
MKCRRAPADALHHRGNVPGPVEQVVAVIGAFTLIWANASPEHRQKLLTAVEQAGFPDSFVKSLASLPGLRDWLETDVRIFQRIKLRAETAESPGPITFNRGDAVRTFAAKAMHDVGASLRKIMRGVIDLHARGSAEALAIDAASEALRTGNASLSSDGRTVTALPAAPRDAS